jgi:hemin uptake protein HemP
MVVPKIATAQLMKGNREVILQHGSEEYRLRITSTGKLILTK